MSRLLDKSEEFDNAENDADQAVYPHKSADDPEDDADDGYSLEKTEEPAEDCADDKENDQLNDERNDVLFLDVERCGPNFSDEIHNEKPPQKLFT